MITKYTEVAENVPWVDTPRVSITLFNFPLWHASLTRLMVVIIGQTTKKENSAVGSRKHLASSSPTLLDLRPGVSTSNSTMYKPSWKASSRSLTKNRPALMPLAMYYSVHNSPIMIPNLSQINPVHVLRTTVCKINFTTVLSIHRSTKHSLPLSFFIFHMILLTQWHRVILFRTLSPSFVIWYLSTWVGKCRCERYKLKLINWLLILVGI